ncbi:MAG: hypothetical protein QM791_21695 [Ferruginibacter sp.]
MKKLFTLIIKNTLLLILFVAAQAKVWAADATTAETVNRSASIFSQPWLWIGCIVIAILILIGPMKQEEFPVIVKKKLVKKDKEAL